MAAFKICYVKYLENRQLRVLVLFFNGKQTDFFSFSVPQNITEYNSKNLIVVQLVLLCRQVVK